MAFNRGSTGGLHDFSAGYIVGFAAFLPFQLRTTELDRQGCEGWLMRGDVTEEWPQSCATNQA